MLTYDSYKSLGFTNKRIIQANHVARKNLRAAKAMVSSSVMAMRAVNNNVSMQGTQYEWLEALCGYSSLGFAPWSKVTIGIAIA